MKEFLAKGKRGLAYRTIYKGKEAVIKEKNPCSQAPFAIKNEYLFLKELNKHNIGPEIYSFEKESLVMEFISGQLITEYLRSAPRSSVLSILKKIFSKTRLLDKLKINKEEMTNPYKHIIIRNNEPVFIDFEKCKKTPTPKNTTQFCQFLTSPKIKEILKNKGININKNRIIELGKKYKLSYLEKDYREIVNLLK